MAKLTEKWLCSQCGAQLDITPLGLYAKVQCPNCAFTDTVHDQVGNFRLEGVLGIGGMSVVYRAVDVVLNRPLAIKVLNDTFRDQPDRIERFENECSMMARVSHENITSVYSAGRAYGQFYIAMELVEGTNLENMVTPKSPMAPARALGIIRDVAQGLQAAHKAGLLHRDMKPGNVLITPKGSAKVIDFGLAVDSREGDTEEIIWATPYYVPPETLQRKPEDVRTDIYALGMTLRYLLRGEEDFKSPTNSLSALIDCKRKLPSFAKQCPQIAGELCRLVDHMTRFSPADRPKDYDHLIEEIDDVQLVLTQLAQQAITPMESRMMRWRHISWLSIGSLAVGTSLAILLRPTITNTRYALVPIADIKTPADDVASVEYALEALVSPIGSKLPMTISELRRIADNTQSPTVSLWCALLTKLLQDYWGRPANANDAGTGHSAIYLHAQQLVQKKLSEAARDNRELTLTLNCALKPFPSAADWISGNGPWKNLTRRDLLDRQRELEAKPGPPVAAALEWYTLGLQAAWLRENSLMQTYRDAMSSALHAKPPYDNLLRVFTQSLDEVSSKFRTTNPRPNTATAADTKPSSDQKNDRTQQKPFDESYREATNMMRNHRLAEAEQTLTALVNRPDTSQRDRARCSVLIQVCQVGQEVIAMLNRRYPGKYKPGMSANDMAALISAPQPKVGSTDSNGMEYKNHLPHYALDGDFGTTWCAPNSNTGHYLGISLKTPTPIDFIEIDWENSQPQKIDLQLVTTDGVSRVLINRDKLTSIISLNGRSLRSFKFTFNDTKQSSWASIREIRLFHKDDFLKREVTIVGLLLEGKYDAAWTKVRELLLQDRPSPYFNIIADNWLKRWIGDTNSDPSKIYATEEDIMKTYQEQIEDPGKLIELCRNCLYVTVKPDKTIDFEKNKFPDSNKWWRFNSLTAGQGMMFPIPIARELVKRGIVTVSDDSAVAILGLRQSSYRDFTLIPGYIQPCRLQDAKYFESRGDGKILYSEKDLEGLRDKLEKELFPVLFQKKIDRL